MMSGAFQNALGYELIEYTERNGWNTLRRDFGDGVVNTYRDWMARNPGRKVRIREVTAMTDYLSNSKTPYYPTAQEAYDEEKEATDSMTGTTRTNQIRDEGASMASALAGVFMIKPGADQGAVFALGRRLAAFAGYQDAEGAFSYIEGFVGSLNEGRPKEIAPGSSS